MTEQQPGEAGTMDDGLEDFAQQIADQVESFLVALREIARENDGGRAISLLLVASPREIARSARRKLPTWSAICWAKSSRSLCTS